MEYLSQMQIANCNFLSGGNLELTGGHGETEKFETAELEVFKVIY